MVKDSGWNHMFVYQQVPGIPLIAFAPIIGDNQPFSEIDQGAEWERRDYEYRIYKNSTLLPDTSTHLDIFFGIGYEEVSAATSSKEMLRQGFDALLTHTETWLCQREKHVDDPVIKTLLNTNLFFSFFYASGRTIDTEELCMMTSRSPRYYVSAAYWDRDSLLWAFPAILMVDTAYARELLTYVFTYQARNFGVHSRYIDGTILEPGFELDELCAPVLALNHYEEQTNDFAFAKQSFVKEGLRSILRKLEEKKHPFVSLYETFLQSTDDMHNYIYLTYNNALVYHALRALAKLLNRPELVEEAGYTRQAIYEHCVKERDGQSFFAWSVDLNGSYDIWR